MIQTPFFEGRVNRMRNEISARSSARQRRRECGLLRGICAGARRLIGRRRGGALAHDLGRLGRRRRGGGAAFLLGRGVGVRSAAAGARPACPWLSRHASISVLPPAAGSCSLRVRVVNLLTGALVEILRHALLKARHAFGEHRLAVAGQLLLGIEEVEQVGRIEIASAATAGQRAGKRDEDSGCDQTLRAAHTGFPNRFAGISSWRPAAARPAALRHASAGSAAFRRHWRSNPAIAASPQHRWRAMPTAPAIRARYGGR